MESQKKQEFTAIGLMTGTALDGNVDAALLKSDGERIFELGRFVFSPYCDEDRAILADTVKAALKWNFNGKMPDIFDQAQEIITRIYADAVEKLLKESGLKSEEVDLIGAHGLSVIHRPPSNGQNGNTLQLLDGQSLANLCGIETVYDFRKNDMENGGQGAPLAPIYHSALMAFSGLKPPVAILNLGGVGNITYWGESGEIIAFDTGPANGPLNELVEKHNRGTYDKDGKIALSGTTDEKFLETILQNSYFNEKYPKSLDRYDFPSGIVDGLSLEDGAATLAALVGESVNCALGLLPKLPKFIVLAGGGRKNPAFIKEIEGRCKIVTIDADEIAMRGDAIEAECFAFLAIRSKLGLPISFPTTTGVKTPLSGGKIANVSQNQ